MKKFGFVDIIIVLLVVALCIAGYSIISDKEGTSTANITDVEFTVELKQLTEEEAALFQNGDDVYDSLKGGYFGKVVDVKKNIAKSVAANTADGTYSIEEYPDRYDVYVTVHGTPTSVTEGNIMFASQKVKVGTRMYIKSKNYVGIGYAVGVKFAQ